MRFREAIVNPAIAFAVLLSEAREIEAVVKHRPKPLVAIAEVTFLKFALRERHRHHGDVVVTGRGYAKLGFIRDDQAVPAEPQSAILTQTLKNADCKPARRLRFRIGDTVGDDDQTAHVTVAQMQDKLIAKPSDERKESSVASGGAGSARFASRAS